MLDTRSELEREERESRRIGEWATVAFVVLGATVVAVTTCFDNIDVGGAIASLLGVGGVIAGLGVLLEQGVIRVIGDVAGEGPRRTSVAMGLLGVLGGAGLVCLGVAMVAASLAW